MNTSVKNLFAYGTLMCAEIMRGVAGCLPSTVPGVLLGYRRLAIKGELYPALVAEEGARVEGVVYRTVPEAAWKRLDRFEGEIYSRHSVLIVLQDGGTLAAETYVLRPEFQDLLAQADWDYADFLRNGKTRFQQHYQGYQELGDTNHA